MNWQSKWSSEQRRLLLAEQFETFWQRDTGIERTQLEALQRAAQAPQAVIISGLRRVGKSTLLAQLAHRLGRDQFYYVNFEDDRFLGFQAAEAQALYQTLLETLGERKVFLVDEIQNVPGWEHFVRRFLDLGFKFYLTGSNASLLSRELGTRLTGRYLPVELFPFSLREYLNFTGTPLPPRASLNTVEKGRLAKALADYLQSGGLPEALKYPALPLLRTLYDDVLHRDIAARYRIESVTALKELAFFLMSNPAGRISYNKLKEQFGLGSVNTLKSYVEYLENSWLVFAVSQYDFSVKRQQIAPKKVYSIDPGLARTAGFSFSPDTGRWLENVVFLELRRQTAHLHYLATPAGFEVDFYLPDRGQLVQVAQHLEHPATREREIRALADALKKVPARRALILADANEDGFKLGAMPVEVRSVAEWLAGASADR